MTPFPRVLCHCTVAHPAQAARNCGVSTTPALLKLGFAAFSDSISVHRLIVGRTVSACGKRHDLPTLHFHTRKEELNGTGGNKSLSLQGEAWGAAQAAKAEH